MPYNDLPRCKYCGKLEEEHLTVMAQGVGLVKICPFVFRRRRGTNYRLTADERQRALQMLADGKSQQQVADEFESTQQAISRIKCRAEHPKARGRSGRPRNI